MMNFNALLFFIVCIPSLHSQIPNGYYSTATANGYTLKNQLHQIIKSHTDRGYNGLWTTYKTSDRDHQNENDNSIFDIYSEIQNGPDPYNFYYSSNQCGSYSNEGDCYNREHIIPQSVFNSASPMVSDAHFIPPTDGKVNSIRANYPHGEVNFIIKQTLNGSILGNSNIQGYSGYCFEPVDDFKGDIARMYFYFATRYQDKVANYTYPMFNKSSDQVFTDSFLNMLLKWHFQDPVSNREIERNQAIYLRQGNRNPFIDNPSYVSKIWGSTSIQISELFFSEYIEGSSNNKAIEISNESGNTIDLSNYIIKKQTNGTGNWSNGFPLVGQLNSGQKYVIVNSYIALNCYDKNNANIVSSASEMSFNGNDPIGLFKNGVLIDIIGTHNGGSANFAIDLTLRRKASSTHPKNQFSINDWDLFSTNTCNDLGYKTNTEANIVFDFSIYPNPSHDQVNILINDWSDIEIYNVQGQKIYSIKKQKEILIENLPKGIYLVKIIKNNISHQKILYITN